jgi:hypothetical protein
MPVHPNSLENLKKGKQFSKTYKPKNTGRRKDYLKEFVDENRVSLADLKIIIENILLDHSFGDLEKIFARGQKTLPAATAAFIKGLTTELKKGKVDVLNSMLDRVYGKATQTNVVEVYDISDDAKKRMDSIFQDMMKPEKEISPSNVLDQKDMEPEDEEG